MEELHIIDVVKKYSKLLSHHSRKKPISEIVIYHSWCKPLEKTMRTLINKSCGTHYCINRDGTIQAFGTYADGNYICATYKSLVLLQQILK